MLKIIPGNPVGRVKGQGMIFLPYRGGHPAGFCLHHSEIIPQGGRIFAHGDGFLQIVLSLR